MTLKFAISCLLVGCVFAAIPACADDPPRDEADLEEESASEDELRTNAQKVTGAWRGDWQLTPPRFGGIVFNADGTFFTNVDTGMRCAQRPGGQAPCRSAVDLAGKYTVTKGYVKLTPKAGTPDHAFYGRYRYKLVGQKLTFTRAGWDEWENPFTKATSYCSEPTDCDRQNLIHPQCLGRWDCNDEPEAGSCHWSCRLGR